MNATTAATTSTSDPAVSVVERFLAMLTVDPAELSVDEVRQSMRLVRSVQAVATSCLLALDERMRDIAARADTPFPVDPTRELMCNGGLRRRDARSLDVQAVAAQAAPQLGRLLAEGATTAAHLDAVGQALQIAGDGRDQFLGREHEIAQRAVTSTVDDFTKFVKRLAVQVQPDQGLSRFEQQRRSTFLKMRVDTDGMTRGSFAFDPERGAAVMGCLDRHVEAMFHSGDRHRHADGDVDVAPGIDPNDHRRALALHALCTRPAGTGGNDGTAVDTMIDTRPVRAEVIVHVDLHTLQTGLHDAGVCRTGHGADLPPETARRLACDADIIPVVLDGRSVPIDVGRAKRLATMHQRRALESVHDTCAMPHCDVGFTRCVIHHLTPWEHGGPSDLANLVPLCSAHHHAVHEGGWTITLDAATRQVTAAPPLGSTTISPPQRGRPAHGRQTNGPQIHGRQTHGQQTQGRQTQGPQIQGPQIQGPQIQGPQIQGPQTQGPQIQGPQIQGPQIQGPQTQGPQIQGQQIHGQQSHRRGHRAA